MDEMKAAVYDGSSVTSPKNWNNPKPGDPCYSLHTDSRNYVVILNDQGGNVMDISNDITATLRAQDHGHPPVICLQANGIDRADTAGCNGCGWNELGVSYTLNTIDRHAVCYEISAGQAREGNHDICQALRARMGTGGGNVPIICEVRDENISKDNRIVMCEDG